MAKSPSSAVRTGRQGAEKTIRLPQFERSAQVRAESFDSEANTIEIVWTTGASVRRYDYWDGVEYDEVLQVDASSVRLDRLNAGAPFLDTHCSYGLDNVIGSVVPGTASVSEGRGIATILLSKAPGVADTVQKIREGVIRNISVGYWIHKVVKTEGDDSAVARWDVVDWEPLEISAVPIPADPGSQVRAEQQQGGKGQALRSCTIVARNPSTPRGQGSSPARTETTMATRTASKKTPAKRAPSAEAEAEKKRLAALRVGKRDEDMKDDEDADSDDERDDDADEENDAADSDSEKDDGGDDERGADDEDGDDESDGKKDDERAAPAVTAKRAAEAAVKAERQRTAKITDMAERAGMAKFGKRHIADGTSAKRFGELVLERMLAQQEKRGKETFSASSDSDVSRERGAKGPNASQREMAEGETHWRKVAGKPAKTA